VIVRAALALAAVASAGDRSVFSSGDTVTYLAPVDSLLRGEYRVGGEAEVFRPPGYPLLLSAAVRLGDVELFTIAFQLLLSAGTGYFVYKLAALLFDSTRVGLLAALLYALEPLSIVFTVKLLSETLFTFFLVLGLYLLALHARGSGTAPLLGPAAAFSACVYVRAIGYYLPVVGFVFLLLGPEWRFTRLRALRAAAFLGACAVLIGAWQVRNEVMAGYPKFSSSEDLNLWLGSLAVVAHEKNADVLETIADAGGGPVGYWERHPEQLQWPMRERVAHLKKEGLENISRRPLLYLKMHLAGCVNTLVNPGARTALQLLVPGAGPGTPGWRPLTVLLGLLLVVTYVLAAVGVVGALPGKAWAVALLVGTAAYFALLSGGFIGTSRYRTPIMPIVCMLAGLGIANRLRTARGGRYGARSVARTLEGRST
jgi:4-amino-4-deoxy-L-arabinose transferase-like glycosyltransferase